jgi:outer membrane autotransporter protein
MHILLLQFMKFAIALAALPLMATAPALAGGLYTNVESNASYSGSDFTTRTTDVHLGYENSAGSLDYYIQGGPAFVNPDAGESDTQFSGKLGASVAATEKLDVYGEVSLLTAEATDNNYGTKIGAKYKF